MRHVMISRKKKGRDEREFILVEVSLILKGREVRFLPIPR